MKRKFKVDSLSLAFIGIIVVLALLFTIVVPDGAFMQVNNLKNILTDAVIPAVFALGMGIIISSAGFDLSIGHTASAATLLTAYLMNPGIGVPAGVAVLIGLGFAALIGLVNGVLVSRFGISSFIVTLAMQFSIIGFRQVITGGRSVYISNTAFKALAAKPLGISNLVIILIVVAILCYIFMEKSAYGRKIQFIGENIEASKFKGIDIKNITMMTFVYGAVLAAFGGMLFAARAGAVQLNSVDSKLLDAITIAIFANVIFGRYKTSGILLVAILISTIVTGMSMMNIKTEWIEFVKGLILLSSIIIAKGSGMKLFNFKKLSLKKE